MRTRFSTFLALVCTFGLLVGDARAATPIWEWKPPYDPPPTLLPLLKERGISIEEWRFCEAIRRGTVEQVTISLDANIDPNTTCDKDLGAPQPALFVALTKKDAKPEIVIALVRKGSNINARKPRDPKPNVQGTSAMDTLRLSLLASMMDATQNTDYFPLYYAARYTNPEMVETVISLGADLSARTGVNGMTAIFATRDIEIARVLLRHGANINDKDVHGRTVLTDAKQSLDFVGKSHYMRPKLEGYVSWLESQGAHE